MASKKGLPWATAALLLLCATVLEAQAASVEALLADINKLPPTERQKQLEEGARREGSLVHYSVSNAELISAYIKAFTNRYPFIKADFWRGSGNQVVFRTLMEHRTGSLSADVISVRTESLITFKKAGVFARYRSPESQFYPAEQYDRDGYFHADSLGLAAIAYNHQLVRKEEAPKSYEDLLDPKMEGESND